MKLIEKKFINHHIEVYQDKRRGTVIRLLDNSGEGGFVDPDGVVTGDHCVMFTNGLGTICSVDEILYLLRKLPLSITVSDDNGYESNVVIDNFSLPPEDEDRHKLLTLRSRDIWQIENWMREENRNDPPHWYLVWTKISNNQTKSLF